MENVVEANLFHHSGDVQKTSSEMAGKLAGSRFSRVIHGNG